MHDPHTQAFVIPYGWRNETLGNGRKWRYWKPLITIWHKDPEKDGSDDSCGWFRPRLNETQKEICKFLAMDEARDPWMMRSTAKRIKDPVKAESYIRGALLLLSRCMVNRGVLDKRKAVTLEEATVWASLLAHNPTDNFRSSLCFRSGYHSNTYSHNEEKGVMNSEEEDKHWREDQARGIYAGLTGYILRERRPWYRHPKWHLWHWELQIHPLQTFKRWVFSRCSVCGRRFKWGEAPISGSWHGGGPRWFKSEKHIWHMGCDQTSPSNKPQMGVGA